ncbi:hypothetical protein BDR03DRAFT_1002993 [Suillus americanus]|nr:hypothetical protein BDR03DRAFT_1002993 [Suillus americanus]
MHTREEVGIAIETARDLEASFAWAPPRSTEPRDADNLLNSPERSQLEVLKGNAFEFDEIDRVEPLERIIPQAILDEVEVVNYNGEGDGWDEATLMSSSCTT